MDVTFREFLIDISLGIGGMVLAAVTMVGVMFFGDYLNLGFLQSEGGVLITAFIVMETFVFTLLIVAVLVGKV